MKYCFLTDDGTSRVVASVYAQYLNFSYRLCSPISPLALNSTLVLHNHSPPLCVQPIMQQTTSISSSSATLAQVSTTTPPVTTPRFDHFCFDAEDGSSIILNYAGILPLMKQTSCETILDQLVVYVNAHMQRTQKPMFVLHLFCHGMQMRGLNQIKRFMILFAKMFKQHFPTQLYACYVHQAPSFFASVYDLLRPILPKASRDKIVVMRKNGQSPSPVPTDDASVSSISSISSTPPAQMSYSSSNESLSSFNTSSSDTYSSENPSASSISTA